MFRCAPDFVCLLACIATLIDSHPGCMKGILFLLNSFYTSISELQTKPNFCLFIFRTGLSLSYFHKGWWVITHEHLRSTSGSSQRMPKRRLLSKLHLNFLCSLKISKLFINIISGMLRTWGNIACFSKGYFKGELMYPASHSLQAGKTLRCPKS